MTAARVEMIRARLQQVFAPLLLEVRDDSHLHAGHPGARDGRGHFHVRIASEQLQGVAPVSQHRRIYDALGGLMQTDIHALSIEVISEK